MKNPFRPRHRRKHRASSSASLPHPGLQTGRVRRVRTAQDLGRFQAGEVLVCDAIQPMMTHLVPLAGAVVERRGGMLIHGAIIARELGIPCVNGVAGAIELLHDGDIVTVDGYLGIVTVGAPEFDLELADVAGERVSGSPGTSMKGILLSSTVRGLCGVRHRITMCRLGRTGGLSCLFASRASDPAADARPCVPAVMR